MCFCPYLECESPGALRTVPRAGGLKTTELRAPSSGGQKPEVGMPGPHSPEPGGENPACCLSPGGLVVLGTPPLSPSSHGHPPMCVCLFSHGLKARCAQGPPCSSTTSS